MNIKTLKAKHFHFSLSDVRSVRVSYSGTKYPLEKYCVFEQRYSGCFNVFTSDMTTIHIYDGNANTYN